MNNLEILIIFCGAWLIRTKCDHVFNNTAAAQRAMASRSNHISLGPP